MRKAHVGDAVVVEDGASRWALSRTLTDLMPEILIPGLAAEDLAVRDVASAPLSTVESGDSLFAAMIAMLGWGYLKVAAEKSFLEHWIAAFFEGTPRLFSRR